MGLARCCAILASAAMFALYARVEQPWALLGWVALVPWLAILDREPTAASALRSGLAMSVAFVVSVFVWFGPATARYTEISPLTTFALLVFAAPLLQPQLLVFAVVRHVFTRRGNGRVFTAIGAACSWVGAEWLFPRLLEDTLGHGLLPFRWLRQGADIAGATGLTFVILLVNEALLAAIHHRARSTMRAVSAAATAVALVSALAAYGALRLRQLEGATTLAAPLTAALVQASLDDYDEMRERGGTFEAVRTILDAHMSLSRGALIDAPASSPVELLVWPETVYPTTFGKPKSAEGAAFDAEIARFAGATRVPLLFGAYDREFDKEYNTVVLLQHDGREAMKFETSRKTRLFPLTETVPSWLDSPVLRRALPWLGTWHPGNGPAILDLYRADGSSVKIVPLICLDAVDSALALGAAQRGAGLIVTLSNDAWFAESRGARLHLAVSAFRSIETRLPQLRATNTGISAVIAATGEIVTESATGERVVLVGTVEHGSHGDSLMKLWGNWFGAAASFGTLVLLGVGRRRRISAGA